MVAGWVAVSGCVYATRSGDSEDVRVAFTREFSPSADVEALSEHMNLKTVLLDSVVCSLPLLALKRICTLLIATSVCKCSRKQMEDFASGRDIFNVFELSDQQVRVVFADVRTFVSTVNGKKGLWEHFSFSLPVSLALNGARSVGTGSE
jgi:hypothetical protein